ncbi:DUF4266 domain-containing protein [Aquimarina sp. D1M17]|uniref:DUF4266 domain-containing protein n=1 Tax=Aquimarina acroporae TaxID=2937283 RepID=UPI0020BF7D3E|nr:DUF4266 domain-containing protein [Aquimarina acroporae]MCK8522723.1 DUF4266 domain-containing protein [Aquimarina acroporae]
MKYKLVLSAVVLFSLLSSCVVVKEYEKVQINDPDMELASKKCDRFETNFQAYRESAAGGNGGRTGGGCGCN